MLQAVSDFSFISGLERTAFNVSRRQQSFLEILELLLIIQEAMGFGV